MNVFEVKSYLVFFFLMALFNTTVSAINESAIPGAYEIGPGDVLNISVWKEEGLDQQILVRPDGGITFPLVGEVQAGGLTTRMLSDALILKLKKYIPNPSVTVSVLQALSNKVYVIGKVNRPGQFAATAYLDVLQALTMAGGLTPYADSDEIKIIRRTETGTKMKLFDYDEVVSGERLDMNVILKAGDTVVVP